MADKAYVSTPQVSGSTSWFKRITIAVAISRPGRWLVRNIVSRMDIWSSHLSKGRLSVTKLLGFPLLILSTTGAKSGHPRETPLLYVRHEENIVVIASSLGSTRHPQWYYNLRSKPQASLLIEGRKGRYSYRLLEGNERQDYWERMQQLYPGYNRYKELAGERHIPVILFTPLSPDQL
jgi:deazaflavin-dependent oxidoreductase (nitroreductase family)